MNETKEARIENTATIVLMGRVRGGLASNNLEYLADLIRIQHILVFTTVTETMD